MELPLRGGCVCGAIRYEIAQEPLRVYACHCKDCQRFTGSAFAIGVVIPSECPSGSFASRLNRLRGGG